MSSGKALPLLARPAKQEQETASLGKSQRCRPWGSNHSQKHGSKKDWSLEQEEPTLISPPGGSPGAEARAAGKTVPMKEDYRGQFLGTLSRAENDGERMRGGCGGWEETETRFTSPVQIERPLSWFGKKTPHQGSYGEKGDVEDRCKRV